MDDNPQLLQMLAVGFKSHDFEVVTASHGIDALMQFHSHNGKFGFILTDNDMPNMGGFQFVKRIRELAYKGRILVMSGDITRFDRQTYIAFGVKDFLQKPFQIAEVAKLLRGK